MKYMNGSNHSHDVRSERRTSLSKWSPVLGRHPAISNSLFIFIAYLVGRAPGPPGVKRLPEPIYIYNVDAPPTLRYKF